jgi:histidyl-tRNA synthetase
LRVLDCKVLACREAVADAPAMADYLCGGCGEHFVKVQDSLKKLDIAFEIDKRLVRGLDYYTRTTFEIQTGLLGAQSAVAGGGRYDRLIEELGGPAQPAIGFAIGFDRLAEIVAANRPATPSIDLFIAALGEQAKTAALGWSCEFSVSGIKTEMDFSDKGLKGQMKKADRLGARYVLILGDKEMEEGNAVLRDMITKEQSSVSLDGIVEKLKTLLPAP